MPPALNANPTLYMSFLVKKNWGDYEFTALQLLSRTKWGVIQISLTRDNIPSQVADKGR